MIIGIAQAHGRYPVDIGRGNQATKGRHLTKADIVDDPHYAGDPLYRQLARSLRNAARVASPLQLPPGDYAAFRDLTLQFNPRQVLR